MDKLTIGKMARINGISEQTLRLYDNMHLLEPCEPNPYTGYRYYNIKQCAKLDMIQYLKALGMNLSQIKEYFDEKEVSSLRDILEKQKTVVHQQIETLRYAEMALNRAVENCNRYDTIPRGENPIIEYLPDRCAYIYDVQENYYGYGMDYYESTLRALKQDYTLHKLPLSYFCNIGKILRKKNFIKKKIMSTEACIFLEKSTVADGKLEIIPGGVYLCVYCEGYENEQASLQSLMQHISEHGYEVTGDCISEVIVELPALASYNRNAFFKIQVPVKSKS